MKYWIVAFVLFLTGCIGSQTQLSMATETIIPISPTPQIVEATRIVKVEQTVVVTVTPEPLLAQECINTALTQLELTSCGALEWQLAREKLDKTISRIKFSPEEKRTFDQLQEEWQKQVETDCEFFYHNWGSMGPMQRNFCIALRYKQRVEELKFAYLNN